MHLTKIDPIAAANIAISALENGMESNSDNLQISFDNRNINPWYSRQVLAKNTGNAHDKIGDQLVSYMNGTSYPYDSAELILDPRLTIYAENTDQPDEPIRGYISGGDGNSSDGETANADFKNGGFYTNIEAPITIITYAEAEFLKAEAQFIVNGGNATSTGSSTIAYEAYLNGINANMEYLGADASLYIADASIAVEENNLRLEHIMKEKYIANFLNPETFVDLRRYDFSTDVFKDLTLPEDHSEGEYPGQWLVRAGYPNIELARNPDNVNSHKELPYSKCMVGSIIKHQY